MISEFQEEVIASLLQDASLSECEIAKRAGVARNTVRKRRAGQIPHRTLYVPRKQGNKISRCRSCGGLVYGECRACALRRFLGILE